MRSHPSASRMKPSRSCSIAIVRRASVKDSRASASGSDLRAPAAAPRKPFSGSYGKDDGAMRRTLVIALALVASTRDVRGTVLLPADVGELAREARTIARGRVTAVEGRWTDDRRAI